MMTTRPSLVHHWDEQGQPFPGRVHDDTCFVCLAKREEEEEKEGQGAGVDIDPGFFCDHCTAFAHVKCAITWALHGRTTIDYDDVVHTIPCHSRTHFMKPFLITTTIVPGTPLRPRQWAWKKLFLGLLLHVVLPLCLTGMAYLATDEATGSSTGAILIPTILSMVFEEGMQKKAIMFHPFHCLSILLDARASVAVVQWIFPYQWLHSLPRFFIVPLFVIGWHWNHPESSGNNPTPFRMTTILSLLYVLLPHFDAFWVVLHTIVVCMLSVYWAGRVLHSTTHDKAIHVYIPPSKTLQLRMDVHT